MLTKPSTWSYLAIRLQGRNHNMKIDNSFLGMVEEFKYLAMTLKY